MKKLILDVSKYQGLIDWDELKKDERIDGVIIKATDGNGGVDERFYRNWAEAKRVGLLAGAYHFAQADSRQLDAVAEAHQFFAIICKAGYVPRTPMALALDIEKSRLISKGREFTQWVIDFCTKLGDLTRVRTGVYTGGPFFDEHDGDPDQETIEKLRRWWLWIAAYVNDPKKYIEMTPWKDVGAVLHQYSGDVGPGRAPGLRYRGITANVVDTNRFLLDVDFRWWLEELVDIGSDPIFYPETNIPDARDVALDTVKSIEDSRLADTEPAPPKKPDET